MKTIVVSGACSGVGKTTLAKELHSALPRSSLIKIGHCRPRPGKHTPYYPVGTPFRLLAQAHGSASHLIIESNSILRDLRPDLLLFLDGTPRKPSARVARQKAHIRTGIRLGAADIRRLARASHVPPPVLRRIAWLVGARPEPVTAILLAGGRSARMGKDKASLTINGKRLIRHLRDQIAPHVDDILVSTAPGSPPLVPGARHIQDPVPHQGPLTGITTALSASRTRLNVVLACDTPCIPVFFLRTLLSAEHGKEIVVPSFRKGTCEPLLGLYARPVLSRLLALRRKGIAKVKALFPLCRTLVLPIPRGRWYANLNTPGDVRRWSARHHKEWSP